MGASHLRTCGRVETVTTPDDAAPFLVPIWPQLVLPVLQVLESGETLHRKDLADATAKVAGVGPAARSETLNSGGFRFEQRMGWALSHLAKAGWVTRPSRGHYAITDGGRKCLRDHPTGFDYALAKVVFAPYWPKSERTRNAPTLQPEVEEAVDILDPLEQIEDGISRIEQEVGEELLDRLRGSHPDFFEQAVVDLLLAMGYGGAEQRGTRIGGSGDEGMDGVIDQDALGLDRIYVQAKRYAAGNNIGRETIQAFVGALAGFGATRGVFLTTSAFTTHAVSYADSLQARVILIDGQRLVGLMIKYRVGVQVTRTYSTVEIDSDFFD